jgi:hypothetical protein
MAKTEQKYLIDRETLEHLIALLRDGLSRGASEETIWDQVYEILDRDYRSKTDQSLKEMRQGRMKRLKNADEMIRDLESR